MIDLRKEHKNLEQKSYELLRDLILSGDLEPSFRLKEEELAAQFNVSRTTVNRALNRLKSDYLLEDSPYHGARVKLSTIEELLEAFDIRAVLEGFASRLAAKYMDDKEIDDLITKFKGVRISDINMRSPKFFKLDFDMHRKIADFYVNKSVPKLLMSFMIQHRYLIKKTKNKVSYPPREVIQDHLSILQALKDRDEDLSEKMMKKHLRAVKEYFVKANERDSFPQDEESANL